MFFAAARRAGAEDRAASEGIVVVEVGGVGLEEIDAAAGDALQDGIGLVSREMILQHQEIGDFLGRVGMVVSGQQIAELRQQAIGQEASTLEFGDEIFGSHAMVRA